LLDRYGSRGYHTVLSATDRMLPFGTRADGQREFQGHQTILKLDQLNGLTLGGIVRFRVSYFEKAA